jgi:hypothetical protein
MADKKISALTGASTPLAGTEVLPIVQSGATVKVSVADLTAGRAISATAVTASTGNFVVGTSGQGIDFSATPGAGTSELLNDYEEGTWTPAVIGSSTAGTATYGAQIGQYTKIGNRVYVNLTVSYSGGTGTGNLQISGLPFASNSTTNNYQTLSVYTGALALSVLQVTVPLLAPSSSTILINYNTVAGGAEGNVSYDDSAFIVISGSYII